MLVSSPSTSLTAAPPCHCRHARADWGEQGYIRLKANVQAKEGLCGIAMAASYPTKTVSPTATTTAALKLGGVTRASSSSSSSSVVSTTSAAAQGAVAEAA